MFRAMVIRVSARVRVRVKVRVRVRVRVRGTHHGSARQLLVEVGSDCR